MPLGHVCPAGDGWSAQVPHRHRLSPELSVYAFKHVTGPSVREIEDMTMLAPDKVPEMGSLILYPVLSTIVIVLVQGTCDQYRGALVQRLLVARVEGKEKANRQNV